MLQVPTYVSHEHEVGWWYLPDRVFDVADSAVLPMGTLWDPAACVKCSDTLAHPAGHLYRQPGCVGMIGFGSLADGLGHVPLA